MAEQNGRSSTASNADIREFVIAREFDAPARSRLESVDRTGSTHAMVRAERLCDASVEK